ncbi:hypothetical protein ABK040_014755 [Willaertia magna]
MISGDSTSTSLSSGTIDNKIKVQLTDVVYEVQERKFLQSFHSKDKVEWKNSNNEPITKESIEERAKQDGWKWLTKEWVNEGEDSWEYANEWSKQQKDWSHGSGALDFVRRKKWTRSRVKLVEKEQIEGLKRIYGEEALTVNPDQITTKIYEQVDLLKQNLATEYTNINQQTQKPNILLLGGSGAGKSSLVNAVFGKTLAEIGEGKPITQQYTKYASEHSPVVIYDSKGIEHGYIQEGFVADTRKFFKKIRSDTDLLKHVHVVWYVIDLTQARFQPFEAQFCREELQGIPIIFVLNKADAVKPDVRDIMIETIANFNMPNCIGIYPTVANCKNFDSKTCPSCGSTKIRKRLKAGTCTIMCKECNYTVTLEKTMGIDQLSRSTLSVLPELVKGVYINSQTSASLGKEIAAKEIITQHIKDVALTKQERVKTKLLDMTSKLVALYDVASLEELIKKKISSRFEKFYKEQNSLRRMSLFFNDLFSRKETTAEVFVLTAGIEICNEIVNFKNAAITHALQTFAIEVNKEIENEKKEETGLSPMQNNVTAVSHSTSASSVHDLDANEDDTMVKHELEPELYVDKLIANIHFKIDSNLVEEITEEIRKAKTVQNYLNYLVFDGKKQYKLPEKKIVVQEEELHIPLYVYQTNTKATEKERQQENQSASETKVESTNIDNTTTTNNTATVSTTSNGENNSTTTSQQ